ncbi:MAG: glutamate formimidoyltransferase [Bacteroidales bacterium]|nr:glutamate formimidoyltransferase [Bacteroidales bacterium]
MKKLIECVPNFSEGRDMQIIRQITDAIESVEGVRLLDVDPGAATNRTVVTFVGEPEPVCQAAFLAVQKAAELIDMSRHHGEHPRMGATDVLPLVPIANVTMEECAEYARALAARVGNELAIPVYCYESAAYIEERRNLAVCRQGEYEGLAARFAQPRWKPDFGPSEFNSGVARTGATAVGARDFLVAINYNLNTTSTRRANSIAFDVREKGRKLREGDPITGPVVKDAEGREVWVPGTLKGCKAIGWYIEEYGIAQVSMNVTNISATPVHTAFDEVCDKARRRGIRVTGAEIVGLIPKKVLTDAGRHYLALQGRSCGIPEADLVKIAVKSMGLDDLKPFNPREKVIEYILEDTDKKPLLADLSVKGFAEETSRESPAPGGGSIAAYMGALAAALGTMVANLSSHKRGWDSRWKEFSDVAEEGEKLMYELLALVDEDTAAFNRIMAALGMPKGNDAEKAERGAALQAATEYAARVPLKTMKAALRCFDICGAMAEKGNPASVSDAGVGALAARSAVLGAHLNVRINALGLKDRSVADALIAEASEMAALAIRRESEILKIVEEKL